jgi:molybdopterin synthase catalytic subunit
VVRIGPGRIDAEALLTQFGRGRPDAGAIVSFTGLVRATSDGVAVAALDLDHYPGFTEAQVEAAAERTLSRFELLDLLVAHRVGPIPSGETVVVVVAAAEHRRAAFEATDSLMDWLKVAAPFWKREQASDGAVRWIEPRSKDHADAARWETPNADAGRPEPGG